MNFIQILQSNNLKTSWLAATNPTAFRKKFRRTQVSGIHVEKLCEDINDRWWQNNNRLSLYIASQLMYGTVCIYQQQIQFLYENVGHFVCREAMVFRELKRSKPDDDKDSRNRKKTKYVNDLYELIQDNDNESVTFQSQNINEISVTLFELNEVNNDAITLRETNLDLQNPAHMNDDDLCSLKSFERQEFAEMFYQPSAYIQASNKNIIFQNIGEYELVFAQSNIDSTQIENDVVDDNRVFLMRHSTPIRGIEQIEQVTQLDLSVADTQHETLVKQPTECVLSGAMFGSSAGIPKKLNKRRLLKIDPKIYIDDVNYQKQILNGVNTLRVLDPRDDHTNLFDILMERNLFEIPCNRRFQSKVLLKKFKRNLITANEDEDEELLGNLDAIEPITLDQVRNFQQNDNSLKLNHFTIEQNLITPEKNIQLPVLTPLDEPTMSYGTEHIIPTASACDNPMLVKCRSSFENSTLSNHMASIVSNEPLMEQTNWSQKQIQLHNRTKEILKKLMILWEKFVHPVGMASLCDGVPSKKLHAQIFFDLMYLKKKNYIRLVKDVDSLEIYHIDKGDEIMNKSIESI